LDPKLLARLEKDEVVCEICKLIIPFVPKKGPRYTVVSFTLVDEKPICYRDYHPDDFEKIVKKSAKK
jgi:hypothetical protein